VCEKLLAASKGGGGEKIKAAKEKVSSYEKEIKENSDAIDWNKGNSDPDDKDGSIKKARQAKLEETKKTLEEDLKKASVRGVDDALQRVPGVKIFDETGTGALPQISVRGLYESRSGRVQALSDGIPLALAPYGQTGLSLFPVTLATVDRIDIVRKASS
jgi:outer membrane receptor for Fe3+-dicitrate